MRRELKFNQSLRVRWLLPLLAFLLLPAGMQAEDYGLTVAGTQVTSDNAANVLGDDLTEEGSVPTVTFDYATNTLTLNGAEIDMSNNSTGYAIESSIDNLTVKLKGYNQITIADGSNLPYAFRYNGASDLASLTFVQEADVVVYDTNAFGMLSISGIYQRDNIASGYKVSNIFVEEETTGWQVEEYGSQYSTYNSVYIKYIEYYNLWKDSFRFNSSNLNPDSGGMHYIPATNTLHIENYNYPGTFKSGMQELTMEICGSNISIYNGGFECVADNPGRLVIRADKNSSEVNKIVIDSEDQKGVFTGFSEVSIEEPLRLTTPSEMPATWDANVTSVVITDGMDLMIGNNPVTMSNYNDVLGDGTVSFDVNNNTLMLNNANIGDGGQDPMEIPGIVYSGTADLTINLMGKNTISGMGGCEAIRYDSQENTAPRLLFDKGDNLTCSLQLNAVGTTVISGFSEIQGVNGINASEGNRLKLDSEDKVLYSNENGLYVDAETNLQPVMNASIIATQQRADIVWKAGDNDYSYEIDGSVVTADAGGYYIYTNGKTPWLYNPDKNVVTFSSSDESVATIDEEGTITFVGMGRTTISATVAETDELLETTSSFTLKVYPENAVFEEEFALLFPGETVTITCPQKDAEIWYYTGEQSRDDAVKYTSPIALTEIGETNFMAFTKFTKNDEVFESSTSVSGRFVVFEQPTISVASGTFNDDVEVTIGKLPTRYGTQVCYYFDDELSDDIYTSTDMLEQTKYHVYVEDEVIKIVESKILKVFIMEQDSGRYYKKKAAEAEYTVIPKTQLNISYASNSREWASYYADEKSLETPAGLQAYVVTEVQETGVTTSPISYIPLGEGVLLKRTTTVTEPIMAKALMEDGAAVTGNMLKGTAENKSVNTENGDVYVLYNDGFTRAPSGSIPAHRAYLVLNNESAGARLLIWEEEEATTAVGRVRCDSVATESPLYNLNGQRVSKPTKGLYISKGKKYIVK